MTSGKKSQVLCGFRHLSPLTSDPVARGSHLSQRNCHLSPLTNGKPLIFAGFLGHLSLFLSSAGGATCPPYDLKSQKGQIEGIIRFYAASATCQGDKLKWTPTCQGTNCGARMFPGFLLNLSLFLSLALGQLGLALSVTAAAVPAPPRGEPSLASPFGGRWCPVGTVQRLTEPAGESVMPLA